MTHPETIGQYTIIELIGRGGMGEVFKAVDTRMYGRIVAIKVASAHLAEDRKAMERFQQEVRTIATLQHPGIAILHDRGEFEGRQYFVMEYLEGRDLSTAIHDRAVLDLEQRIEIAAQVADALAYAHSQGVVHRDIKPSNIMVMTKGGGPQAKLLDFGIAHVVRADPLGTIAQPGTTPYMSPEQLKDEAVDGRSDLFCLGIVLYELFTGIHPFASKTPHLVVQKILSEDPPPTRTIDLEVPEKLDALILQLLRKSPGERPPGASEVAQRLRQILREHRALQSPGGRHDVDSLEGVTSTLLQSILMLSRNREERGDLAEALKGYRRAALLDPYSSSLRQKIDDLQVALAARPPASTSSTTVQVLSDPPVTDRDAYVRRALAAAGEERDRGALDRASAILADVLRRFPDEQEAAALLERLMVISDKGIPYKSYRTALVQGRQALEDLDFEGARKAHAVAWGLWSGDEEAVALGSAIEERLRDEISQVVMQAERKLTAAGASQIQSVAGGGLGDAGSTVPAGSTMLAGDAVGAGGSAGAETGARDTSGAAALDAAARDALSDARALLQRAEALGAEPGLTEPLHARAASIESSIEERERLERGRRDAIKRELAGLRADARREMEAAAKEESRGMGGLDAALAACLRADDLLARALALDASETGALQQREEVHRALEELRERMAVHGRQRSEARAQAEEARGLLREAARLAEEDEEGLSRALALLEEIRNRMEPIAGLAPEESGPGEVLDAAAALHESATARLKEIQDSRKRSETLQRLLLEADKRVRASRERSHSSEAGVSRSLEEARSAIDLAKEALAVDAQHEGAAGILRQAESLAREMTARLDALRAAKEEDDRRAREMAERAERRSQADSRITRARELRAEAESLGSKDAADRKTALLETALQQVKEARDLLPEDATILSELGTIEALHSEATSRLKQIEALRRREKILVQLEKAQSLVKEGRAREALAVLDGMTREFPHGELGSERDRMERMRAEALARLQSQRAMWVKRGALAAALVVLAAVGLVAARWLFVGRAQDRQFSALKASVEGMVQAAESHAEPAKIAALEQVRAGRDQIENARRALDDLSRLDSSRAAATGLGDRLEAARNRLESQARRLSEDLAMRIERARSGIGRASALVSRPDHDRGAILDVLSAVHKDLAGSFGIDRDNAEAHKLQEQADRLDTEMARLPEPPGTLAVPPPDSPIEKRLKSVRWNLDEARNRITGAEDEVQKGFDYCKTAESYLGGLPRKGSHRPTVKILQGEIDTVRRQLLDRLDDLRKPTPPPPPPPVVQKIPVPPSPKEVMDQVEGLITSINQTETTSLEGASTRSSLATRALSKLESIPGAPETAQRKDTLEKLRARAEAWRTMLTYAERYNAQDVDGILQVSRAESREDLEKEFKKLKKPPRREVREVQVTWFAPDLSRIKVKFDMRDKSAGAGGKILDFMTPWKDRATLVRDGEHYVIQKM